MLPKEVNKELRAKSGRTWASVWDKGIIRFAEAWAWRDKDRGKAGAALNVLADLCVKGPVRQRSILLTRAFAYFGPTKVSAPAA